MQYSKQSTSELIELLCVAGQTPHPDLIDEIWARRTDTEPLLLQTFVEGFEDSWEREDDPRWFRFNHAGKFMLAWHNEEALPTFVRPYSTQDQAILDICEWFEEDLSFYGPAAIPALTEIIGCDSHNDWHYGRALAGSTLTRIAKQHPHLRDEIAAIFRDQLPPVGAVPDEHDIMWSSWAEELGQLADETSREQVLALASAKVFSRDYFSRLHYLRALQRGFQAEEPEPTIDIRAEYRSGYEYEVARKRRERQQRERPQREPRRSTPAKTVKIGRNTPCPCGSGKKYKHCHGQPGGPLN